MNSGTPPPLESDPNPGLLRSVLHGLYDLIWIVAAVLGSPWWILRSAFDSRFRTMVARRLTIGLPRLARTGKRRILIHGVSVGEVKAAQPLVQALRERAEAVELVISATTHTGAAVAAKLFPDLVTVRFPLDVSFLIRRFLRRVRPDVVVLVELEIWPNFLRHSNRAGIPVAVVNGRITEGSFEKYMVFRDLLPQFNRISVFCVQDEAYAARFAELARSPERIVVTGNLKFDALEVTPEPESASELARFATGAPGQVVIVAGSTHDPEEEWFAAACAAGSPGARLVVVPRHPDRTRDVSRALETLGPPPQLLTALRAGSEALDPRRTLLVDTIGELEEIYRLSDLVFVGGSLVPHGGQNMLEPAANGRPVIYGPHVGNFVHEAALLERVGASRRVHDRGELETVLRELAVDSERRRAMSAAGIRAVEECKGATEKTLSALDERCLQGLAVRANSR